MSTNTSDLKKFSQTARRKLREQVAVRLEQVLKTDSVELREKEQAVRELRQQIAQSSKQAVIDRVAYTWFNRFCALRFMDVNRYNRIGVVSPAEGYTQPEILQEAKQGYIDEDLNRFVNRQAVFDLLGGKAPSKDPQQEAYRLLLVGVCNSFNTVMPFLFEQIADYTELLMPQDLLSENSILHAMRTAMTLEACQDVEVIGWLYQYYISERKDEVFAALKENQKIKPEDIPAATQLFTPHWIVRYLVENSLGRLWMLNHPDSRLVEKMEYYIKPVQEETDFLKISSPEELKLCDPACGSGHMLTYAFDLLYAIYEEEGFTDVDIPHLILEKNLYGIEIDGRAGALTAFALFMKARGKDRRFFNLPTQPNICVLENITFTDQELNEYTNAVGRDLFTEPLLQTLKQFAQADNFGSLIRPILTEAAYVRQMLEEKNLGSNLFLFGIHERVKKVLRMAEYLSPRYHVVVANPPYMSNRNMNSEMKGFSKDNYPYGKSNLCCMFMEQCLNLATIRGQVALITLHGWLFLSTYEGFRSYVIQKNNINTLAHLGAHAFDEIGGEVVTTVAFVLDKNKYSKIGIYIRLLDGKSENQKEALLRKNIPSPSNPNPKYCFEISLDELNNIPGSPIIYWISDKKRNLFRIQPIMEATISDGQNKTSDNEKYLRQLWEVNKKDIGINKNWLFYAKGGGFRRWYGNIFEVINWTTAAREFFHQNEVARIIPEYLWYRDGITWGLITSSKPSFRTLERDSTFDVSGSSIFLKNYSDIWNILGILNSTIANDLLMLINPTLAFQVRDIRNIPRLFTKFDRVIEFNVKKLIDISRKDWNNSETSWGFDTNPIFKDNSLNGRIEDAFFKSLFTYQNQTSQMKLLEEENNSILIEAYDLKDEYTPEVPLEEITLICNPRYRYGGGRAEEEYKKLQCADMMKEFMSYAIGCMFGRYSLDKPGLILANQGETLQDYLRQVPDPTFTPDDDNAIPILDGDWFSDDIVERFKKFLRVTFGDEHYDENLAFIEEAIGRDIRSYFLKEFYTYHVKMYQKRPIYWLFSSPKGSFNVLIYMHRYNKDTISVILNRYLREFRAKLEARKGYLEQISISASASPREKTAALKDIEKLSLTLEELRVYERDVLFPLAARQIEIDLDDGVKVNYAKFGGALAKVSGLSE